jgi:hypothetical protein
VEVYTLSSGTPLKPNCVLPLLFGLQNDLLSNKLSIIITEYLRSRKIRNSRKGKNISQSWSDNGTWNLEFPYLPYVSKRSREKGILVTDTRYSIYDVRSVFLVSRSAANSTPKTNQSYFSLIWSSVLSNIITFRTNCFVQLYFSWWWVKKDRNM